MFDKDAEQLANGERQLTPGPDGYEKMKLFLFSIGGNGPFVSSTGQLLPITILCFANWVYGMFYHAHTE